MLLAVAVSDVLLDEELCVRLVVAQIAVEMFVWLPFLVNSDVLFKEKAAFEDSSTVKASVLELRMFLLTVLVEIDEVPSVDTANVTGELQVRLVFDDVILEREVAFEGQLAVHAGIRDLDITVVGFEVLFQRVTRVKQDFLAFI